MYDNYNAFGQAVVIPLFQASITALAVAWLCGAAGLVYGRFWVPLAAIGGGGGFLTVWVAALIRYWRGQDIRLYADSYDRAEVAEEVIEDRRQTLTVQLISEDHRSGKFIHFGVDAETMRRYAERILGGTSLAQSNWIGRGKLFSRASYTQLIDEMTRRGLIAPINASHPASGYELTKPGRAVFERLAAVDAVPHPTNGTYTHEMPP